ncbi:UNVERIFIED_CONTAM: hypothetical protein K2H54_008779 [Gekko kuhli]
MEYNLTAEAVWNAYTEASWAYNVNITDYNKQIMLEKNLEMSSHTLQYGLQARQFDSADFQDPGTRRILKKLRDIERAALPDEELREYNQLLSDMETTYSVAKVCNGEKGCKALDPGKSQPQHPMADRNTLPLPQFPESMKPLGDVFTPETLG